ncbi:hypothetical protein Cha6605_5941 [Chamaesiphon minutus PCC 6605]|uniref:Uncharacterized protein n=1 Tax=Chamaesiphon minutus (strain ATCC 27169 / PCC 6605) TaxID=1173020 RepID=K9UNY2_CHAP6|nr:hypothetical protein Cha6605_5941 [Chamaesiphon minutus PCC 6605]
MVKTINNKLNQIKFFVCEFNRTWKLLNVITLVIDFSNKYKEP